MWMEEREGISPVVRQCLQELHRARIRRSEFGLCFR
jgi:hypothetical protein